MTNDIRTVAWKELLELRRGSQTGRSPLAGMVVLLIVLAVGMPAFGGEGFGPFAAMAIGPMIASIWALTSVPDAFAGERDRRTIETLLASRLPDRSILLGKISAHLVVAVGLGAVGTLLAVITSNVAGALRDLPSDVGLPWAEIGIGALATVLVALFFTNLGVLVALRASSALAAQRQLGLILAGVAIVASVGGSALPKSWQTELSDLGTELGDLSAAVLVPAAALVFVALNWALLAATTHRFVRSKLTGR